MALKIGYKHSEKSGFAIHVVMIYADTKRVVNADDHLRLEILQDKISL
jgi:hypothetical protein